MADKTLKTNILIFIFIVVVLLFAAEGMLAATGFRPYYGWHITEADKKVGGSGPDAQSFDEMFKKGLIKSALGNLEPDRELGYTYYSEPNGFLDKKNFYDNWSAYTRVLALGDSFVGGSSASPGKGFVSLLEEHYRKQKVLFFNTGVGGYSQNNELAVIKKYFRVIKPQMVIVGFYTGNDFLENLMPMDRFTAFPEKWISNYEVVFTKTGVIIQRRSPQEVFFLYRNSFSSLRPAQRRISFKEYFTTNVLYRSRLGTISWLAWRRFSTAVSRLSGKKDSEYVKYYQNRRRHLYSVTRGLFIQMKEFLAQRDCYFCVLIIPDRCESRLKLVKSHDYLDAVALCKELSIPYIDAFDALTLDDYVRGEGDLHWNDSGHFKAYTLLKEHIDALLKKGVVSRGKTSRR